MKTLSVTNLKGGVGKSATVCALAAGLQRKGLHVVVVDVDPQRNSTAQLGAAQGLTVYDMLTGSATAKEALQITPQAAVIPSDSRLAMKGVLQGRGDETRLKRALEPLQGRFDVAILDTPPNVGALTVGAMIASDGVIIPTVPDKHSVEAVTQTAASIDAIRRSANKGLRILGILPTMVQRRFIVHQIQLEQLEQIAAALGVPVFEPVRYSPVVQEVEFTGQSVFDARKGNPAAIDYQIFVSRIYTELKGELQ